MSKREPNSVSVLLRIPIFRRLWSAIAISSLGDWLGLLATTALAAYLTKDDSSIAQGAAVSGVLLTRLLPDLILSPFAGALVDKFDRRTVAIVGDTLAGLLYVSILVSGNLLWLLIAQFLVEAIGLFSTPAKQAMWVNIVPRERLAVANQLNYVSVYGMVPVAAAIFVLLSTVATFFGVPDLEDSGGGALISGSTNTLAIDIALGLDAVTYFFSAGMVLISRDMIPPFVGERSATKNIFSLIIEGVSFIRKNRLMRAIYIGILGAFGAGGLVAGVAQAYVATLGAGNAGYGILFGTVFTGLAIGMLIGPKVFPTIPRRMIFTPAIGAAGISLVVMSVLQDFLGAAITAFVMGVFAGVAWINGFTMIGHEVSDQLRGRVFAFVMSSVRIILLATIAAGPILAGAIGPYPLSAGDFRMEISGPALVLAAGGLIALLVSLYAGRQIGGLTSGFTRRLFRRQQLNIWDEQDEHAGALIAIEGAEQVTVSEYADAIEEHLRKKGLLTVRVRSQAHADPVPMLHDGGPESPADALRATADLADLSTARISPSLQDGAVVICEGFVDAAIVRYRAIGLEEQRLARVAQWAVNGLKPDLTVVVDTPAGNGRTPDSAVRSVTSEKTGAASGGAANGAANGHVPGPLRPEEVETAEQVESEESMSGLALAGQALSELAEPGQEVPERVDETEPAVTPGEVSDAEPSPGRPVDSVTHPATGSESGPAGHPGHHDDHDDDEQVDPAQAYRDRASYAPERYMIVQPHRGALPLEVVERLDSVLRQRTPALADPQPAAPPKVSA